MSRISCTRVRSSLAWLFRSVPAEALFALAAVRWVTCSICMTGHQRKTQTRLACPRRFHRGVERQNIGLERNFID
jgi:hypothetical protein